MNKEAIERTKARCKSVNNRFLVASVIIDEAELKEMLDGNQQLFNQFRNPKHTPQIVPVSYGDLNKSSIEFFNYAVLKVIIGIAILFVCGLIFLFPPQAKADIYIKIGSGYKFIETDHITRANGEKIYYNTGGKFSARIEIGKESGNWTYGISHHSQWLKGFPVNNEDEPQKSEIFIDYKWAL